MTSKKQTAANRRNAKKSTGPTTPEGKAKSSRNRITHGLLSRQVLLKEEDPDRFREVGGMLWEELRPLGELETYLAARIVFGIWRMNRVARIEAGLFNDSPIRHAEPDIGIGQIFKSAVNNGGDPFSKLRRYETAIDLGIQRAWRLLRTVQAERRRTEEAAEAARRKTEREEAIFDAIRDRHLPASARAAITGRRETPAQEPPPEFPFEPIPAQGQAPQGPTADSAPPPPAPARTREGGQAGRNGVAHGRPSPAHDNGGGGEIPFEAIAAHMLAGSAVTGNEPPAPPAPCQDKARHPRKRERGTPASGK